MKFSLAIVSGLGVFLFVLTGCKSAPQKWEIVADNESASSCEVSMDIGPGDGVNAPDLGGGEKRILQSGSAPLEVRTVKVVWNRRQQVFTPRVEVPLGKQFNIKIDPKGNVTTTLKEI